MSGKNHFIAGVTDEGFPRAAKGGFPYPGHLTLGEQRERAERKSAKISAAAERRRSAEFGLVIE